MTTPASATRRKRPRRQCRREQQPEPISASTRRTGARAVVPAAAAVGYSAEGAARAHQAEQNAGERGVAFLRGVRRHADLEQAESHRVAKDDGDERDEPGSAERAEQARSRTRLDAPSAQWRRAQEEQRADAARRGAGEPLGVRRMHTATKATSIGPAMKISSISTDSAITRWEQRSSASRCRSRCACRP